MCILIISNTNSDSVLHWDFHRWWLPYDQWWQFFRQRTNWRIMKILQFLAGEHFHDSEWVMCCIEQSFYSFHVLCWWKVTVPSSRFSCITRFQCQVFPPVGIYVRIYYPYLNDLIVLIYAKFNTKISLLVCMDHICVMFIVFFSQSCFC